MADLLNDLWPDDVHCDDLISPKELLAEQAKAIEVRTSGLVKGEVLRSETKDRVVLGLELFSSQTESRLRLFDAQHRKDAEYPVALNLQVDPLPNFLRERYLFSTEDEEEIDPEGQWIRNEWVANTPDEFSDVLGKALKSQEIRAAVMSFIARARRGTTA